MFKKNGKKIFWRLILVLFIGLMAWLYLADFGQNQKTVLGVTFSDKYATELKLNPRQVFLAVLDDLQVRQFRLIAYWDEVAVAKDSYDFSNLDWQIDQLSQRQGWAILAIGQRLPRWPECHVPAWTATLDQAAKNQALLNYLTATVNRYKDNPAIVAWQVENEPFLSVFGECPKLEKSFYQQELNLVRSLDDRPIVITESGELSTWLRAAALADYVGTSIYRVTWNKHWGYFYYPLPPAYYYLKRQIVKLFTQVDDIMVSEMQMEPWLGRPVVETSIKEQSRSMDSRRFAKNLRYAERTGLSPVYLWGAEWWYWLKEQGDPGIWNLAKEAWEK